MGALSETALFFLFYTMNAKPLIAALLGLATLAAPLSIADTVAGTPDATVHYQANKVGAALAALPLLNEVKPNSSARYYIYLCSAGWCGPCNCEMPHVVEAYKEMKESGLVELVLVDFDRSPEAAREFVAKYGVTFPATMRDNGVLLPGFKSPRGIPSAIIVDAEGNEIKSGHGALIRSWKSTISDYENVHELKPSFPDSVTLTLTPRHILAEMDGEEDADDAAAAQKSARETTGGEVVAAMRKIKWFNGKPSKKAQYYIYLQSASWCGPCRKEMPEIAEEYKAMKKDGRVELVLLGGDRSVGAAKDFLKNNKAKFPGVLLKADGVAELPGVRSLPNYFPAAAIVKADGTVVKAGHGSIVKDWRQYTIESGDAASDASED